MMSCIFGQILSGDAPATFVHREDGEAAMQEVFHVHLHIIPRFAGDGFGIEFPPSYPQRPDRGELEDAARKIAAQL